jgi:Trk K+ transport system NAD-binding subunit
MSTASRLRRQNARQQMHAAESAPRPTASSHPRQTPGMRARLRYAFDNSMSHGPSALIWYLAAAVLLVVLVFAALILIFGAGPTHNPITAIYNVLLHTIDTGTQANDTGTTYEALDLAVTVLGIFIFSAFIGVLANSIDSRLQDLRKGRSAVLEQDHTLILGWSDSIFTILSELSIANESRHKPSVVILADHDKVEMEDAIRTRVPDLRGTKVVCRTGDPMVGDLERVNHAAARSVIVLAPESEQPDAMVIKTILSLTRGPDRREAPYHIVAEISDARNLQAAQLAGGPETVILDKGLSVSRLIVQTSRQSGVAFVYQDLLDFDGDEIYMRVDERMVGQTYGDALFAYEDCSVIGIRYASGGTTLNPAMDSVIEVGDQLIAIAEDDSILAVAEPVQAVVDESVISLSSPEPGEAEVTLVLGYNRRTATVISELDEYAEPGSRVDVVATTPPDQESFLTEVGPVQNLTVSLRHADTSDRSVLDTLEIPNADRVVVMCDSEELSRQHADARVLITLLHLRDIADKTGADFTIVSEILEEADRELTRVANVDDIILSEQVTSYLLAQISENRDLHEVFDELFQSEGSEIYMRPVHSYVTGDGSVSFATLVEAARQRGETAFGYRVAADANNSDESFGVHVNPTKSRAFGADSADRLIVLAED